MTADTQCRIWRKEIERKTKPIPGSYQRDVLNIFDELSYQWKEANHSGRALEKIIRDRIGNITMCDYLRALDDTAIPGIDKPADDGNVGNIDIDELESDI